MFEIIADGTLVPLYVFFKVKHSYKVWTEGELREQDTIETWANGLTIVIPYFKKLYAPKFVIGDNMNSHITINEECENNYIKFVLLSPNSRQILQPLDVEVS